ncbi:MAG: hypothetical protein DI596_10005 [Azospira oryzae]|nr:MAG: hypothetical protein DI596_10005 [Azospira oryzae]PZP78636.1 MAG: hypothetical protein DI593_10005 [Azospira oryzae]
MRTTDPTGRWTTALLLAAAVTMAVPPATWADPPPWAPAHGWRKKHDPFYVGYSGHKWPDDYGIISGRCKREAIGAVLGGAVGAAVGSQVGKGQGKAAAVLIGGVVGAVIGAKIGREMDQEDRACFGHALELAKDRQTVTWSNPHGVTYTVTPLRGFTHEGRQCREYDTVVTVGGTKEKVRGKACQVGEGEWRTL